MKKRSNKINDKEKQIEEMAKRIHIATDLYYMNCIKVATYLFEKDNCRIINKDSVVLSREEYDELTLTKQSIFDMLEERDDKARKETAEKILNSLLIEVKALDDYESVGKFDILGWLEELAKQFGVEIKE